jgi:hypothetical protein
LIHRNRKLTCGSLHAACLRLARLSCLNKSTELRRLTSAALRLQERNDLRLQLNRPEGFRQEWDGAVFVPQRFRSRSHYHGKQEFRGCEGARAAGARRLPRWQASANASAQAAQQASADAKAANEKADRMFQRNLRK